MKNQKSNIKYQNNPARQPEADAQLPQFYILHFDFHIRSERDSR